MSRYRLAILALVVLVGGSELPVCPGQEDKAKSQPDAAFQKMQDLLDEDLVDTKTFQKETPLDKFLEVVTKRLPPGKQVTLGIDAGAFGDKLAQVAATPVLLPARPDKMSLRRALETAMAKSKIKIDYRLDGTTVVITTPERALLTRVYDIRDIIAKSPTLAPLQGLEELMVTRPNEPARNAAGIVPALLSALDGEGEQATPADAVAIQILNGNRLVIRANAARHAKIADILRVFRRSRDMVVYLEASLYEIDGAWHRKLKSAKHLSMADIDALEKAATEKGARFDNTFEERLAKQKLILAGEKVKLENGLETTFLSRHQVVRCLARPEQLQRGDKTRQTVLDGVSFLAAVQVTPDRRCVRIKLTEKARDLEAIDKVKVWGARTLVETTGEEPFVKDSTNTRTLIIPDGASLLVAVHYCPRSVQARDKGWALLLSPRISIFEEEEFYQFGGSPDKFFSEVVADILTNPRLKTTREFYGSPDDKRFALVNSEAWTWPDTLRPAIPGFQMVPAERKGKRLLGIRVDHFPDVRKENTSPDIMVTLVNAGGSSNGAVVGGGTIRYQIKSGKKGLTVELAEPANP